MRSQSNDQAKEQIRMRADIGTIVGRYVNLKGHGPVMKGLCPFHKEKTPSFQVNTSNGFYYCFGCGKGGDVFTFLQEMEGLDFREALEQLADETGVELPNRRSDDERQWRMENAEYVYDDDNAPPAMLDDDELLPPGVLPSSAPMNGTASSTNRPQQPPRAKSRRQELLDIHEMAAEFFYGQMMGNKTAIDYFKSRGLGAHTVKEFRIGFAPPGWTGLCDHLRKKGVPDADIVECGLAVRKDSGAFYDRFRNRVIFPLCDQGGKVVAFAGRGLDADTQPKYLNSPETPLYSKSQFLYGLHKARQGIRSEGFVIAVEGYMDFMTLYQAGITNVVAVSGTALTEDHAHMMKRHTKRVVLVFDGDRAGQSAARRAIFVLAPSNLQVSVLTLPAGDDPDSLVKRDGAESFRARLKTALPAEDFIIDKLLAESDGSPQSKSAVIDELIPYARAMTDAIVRDEFLKKLSQRLGIDSSRVFERLTKNWTPNAPVNNSQDYYDYPDFNAGQGFGTGSGFAQSERATIGGLEESFLKILVSAPELIDMAKQYIPPDSEIITCALTANVYSIIAGNYAQKDDRGKLIDACANDPAAANIIARILAANELTLPPEVVRDELEQKILLLRREFIKAQMKAVTEELKICPNERKAELLELLSKYGAKLKALT